jgi:hypothetical protein
MGWSCKQLGTTDIRISKILKSLFMQGSLINLKLRLNQKDSIRDKYNNSGVFLMIVIDLNGDGNLTDEFNAGNYWVNSLNTAVSPVIPSTTSVHNFRSYFKLRD